MKILLTTILCFIVFSIQGCVTAKSLQATGGSKSDGIVELSFEYGMFEKPQVNWDEGDLIAIQRCQAWGYKSADRFGGTVESCQARNGYGNCVRTFVTVKYQCHN